MTDFTKFFSVLLILFCTYVNSYAQWCVPVVTQNFSHGILRFTIDGSPPIDRSSSSDEHYIFTGMSTTLRRGTTYNVTFTQNYGGFCSLTNLRIWIDYNKDLDFEDAGELVVSITNASGAQHQASFTVPMDAVLDSTRMRVASKMTQSCGHLEPSPCNIPPDPFGWHGEFEDYTVLIANPTGVTPVNSETPALFELAQNYPNPFNPVTKIKFNVSFSGKGTAHSVKLTVYDVLGTEINVLVNGALNSGSHEVSWDGTNYPSGIYYYKLQAGDYSEMKKMILLK